MTVTRPMTFTELRTLLPGRNRSPFEFLVGAEEARDHDPEAAYVVLPSPDGGFRVTAVERGKTLYDRTFPDEASTVEALDRALPHLRLGAPVTAEQITATQQETERLKRELLERAAQHVRAQDQ